MAGRRRRSHRPRGAWFWRHRGGGPPAIAELLGDGRWSVTIGGREIGTVASRQAAELLIDRLEMSVGDRGRRGE